METAKNFEGFVYKTKEQIREMNQEQAKERLKVLDAEFRRVMDDPELDEVYASARQPIDAEFSRIFDQFPELETWYENEL